MQERFRNGNSLSWGTFTSLKEAPAPCTESEKTRAVEIRAVELWIKASQPVWDGDLQSTRNSYRRRKHWLKPAPQTAPPTLTSHCVFLGLSPCQPHWQISLPIEFPGFKAMFPRAVPFFWSFPCMEEEHTEQTSVGFWLVNLSASLLDAVRVKTWAKRREAYPLCTTQTIGVCFLYDEKQHFGTGYKKVRNVDGSVRLST